MDRHKLKSLVQFTLVCAVVFIPLGVAYHYASERHIEAREDAQFRERSRELAAENRELQNEVYEASLKATIENDRAYNLCLDEGNIPVSQGYHTICFNSAAVAWQHPMEP